MIACSTVSTGDDQIAIKGGHWVEDLVIAHMHFGTGHGMSIGSETYGEYTSPGGMYHRGVQKVLIKDLTIDADSRAVGHEAHSADFNGIRIKSDTSRGGLVDKITYDGICMRDMVNAILVSTAYNPLFAGDYIPDFRELTFRNVRHVTCMALNQPVVTLEGFNATEPAGPITLDNVQIDNFSQQAVTAQFSNIVARSGRRELHARRHGGQRQRHAPRHAKRIQHAPRMRIPEVAGAAAARRMEKLMNRIGKATIVLGLVSLGLALAPWACMDKDLMQAKSALCSRNESVPCGATPDGGASTGGLLGYTCPREARPDMDPHYNQGVPQGLVCGDFGAANGDDTQNYCCSARSRRARTTPSRSARRTRTACC